MALAEVVAAAPDSAHHTGDQLRTLSGVFKTEMPQEQHIPEDEITDTAQHMKGSDGVADAGYIPMVAGWEDGTGFDSRNVYPGILADNGQPMYYTPGYGYPQQSTYCSQPQGPYISSMGAGAPGYGPHYGHFYQQVPSSSVIHYYPTEQEGSKLGSKKSNLKDGGQISKVKPGVNGRQGYQVGYRNSLSSDMANQWGVYPAAANGGFYGSPNGYDYYSQQWHSSAQGFQPIPAPQNMGMHGSCIPSVPGGGPGRYQNSPKVHSAPNMSGRGLKGCSVKGGSAGSNWRAKEVTKLQGKGEGFVNNVLTDAYTEQTQKSFMVKSKVHPTTVQECGDVPDQADATVDNQSSSVNRNDFNKENFQISYDSAKFFIIKSYSEDDVHKSIKYGVWSSTPNGNKRLDEAHQKAQEKIESPSTTCPVFFFFSVNCSGQFCGVAEMVGSVDFSKNMDFWLQGKWNGCLPVKWHIIKDVPNGHFRHIILSNNDNKPVTHSRDTQEVHFHQGLEMLKIFKFFPMRTSLLDDFAFYDGRQKVLQERKSRQQLRQQVVKQIKEKASEKISNVADVLSNDIKENGRPTELVEIKAKVENIQCKVAELKVDGGADSNNTAESSEKEKVNDMQETISGNGEDKSNKPKVVDSELLATMGKDDMSRTVINYKKALLEGMQAKVIVLDQTIGA